MNTTQDWAERGGAVIPNETFSHRPVCKVVSIGRGTPLHGSRENERFFIAQYPNGEQRVQWETDVPARFIPAK